MELLVGKPANHIFLTDKNDKVNGGTKLPCHHLQSKQAKRKAGSLPPSFPDAVN
jgi:hypothetical protein